MSEKIKTAAKPTTILTGFLGSGKTTYLNYLLNSKPHTRFAIIENEYGEQSIDSELIIRAEDDIVELNNGCLCCTLNDNLYDILNTLFDRREELSGHEEKVLLKDDLHKKDSFVNETVYRWDEQKLDWLIAKKVPDFRAQLVNHTAPNPPLSAPIEVAWSVLMDIQYRLRYFEEIEMEMYAPVFSKALEALHEKEISIKGFVIPFDEEEELLSLSFNPYASCFFCGKASPASVMSIYLKNKGKRYKVDNFKKFKGTLYLNYDDPNEFYYILKDAKEE